MSTSIFEALAQIEPALESVLAAQRALNAAIWDEELQMLIALRECSLSLFFVLVEQDWSRCDALVAAAEFDAHIFVMP